MAVVLSNPPSPTPCLTWRLKGATYPTGTFSRFGSQQPPCECTCADTCKPSQPATSTCCVCVLTCGIKYTWRHHPLFILLPSSSSSRCQVLFNQFAVFLPALVLLAFASDDGRGLRLDNGRPPTVPMMLLHLVGLVASYEFFFYYGHLLLHHPKLYV